MDLLLSDIVMCETVIKSSMRAVRRFDSFCRQSESSVAPNLPPVGVMVKQVFAQYLFTTSRYLTSASSLICLQVRRMEYSGAAAWRMSTGSLQLSS